MIKKSGRLVMKNFLITLGLVVVAMVTFSTQASACHIDNCDITATCVEAGGQYSIDYAITANTSPDNATVSYDLEIIDPSGNVLTETGTFTADTGPFSGSVLVEECGTYSISGYLEWAGYDQCVLEPITVECTCGGLCWATYGGVKFDSVSRMHSAEMRAGRGPRDTLAGVAFPSCDPEPSEGCQCNHVFHSLGLHFQGWSCEFIECGNFEEYEPGSESPVTEFNYIDFQGEGTLKGIQGNKMDPMEVSFFIRLVDGNEPGNENPNAGEDLDRYYLEVFDQDANTVLLVADENGEPITITGGNIQIHKCQN
jgi:hypothetical protein